LSALELLEGLWKSTFNDATLDEAAWNSMFGLSKESMAKIWEKYGEKLRESGRRPWSLLWAFSWMKIYPTFNVLSLIWRVRRTVIEKEAKATIAALFDCMDEVRALIYRAESETRS